MNESQQQFFPFDYHSVREHHHAVSNDINNRNEDERSRM